MLPHHLILGQRNEGAICLVDPDMETRNHRHPRRLALHNAQATIPDRGQDHIMQRVTKVLTSLIRKEIRSKDR